MEIKYVGGAVAELSMPLMLQDELDHILLLQNRTVWGLARLRDIFLRSHNLIKTNRNFGVLPKPETGTRCELSVGPIFSPKPKPLKPKPPKFGLLKVDLRLGSEVTQGLL